MGAAYVSGALKAGGRAFVIVPYGMLTRSENTMKEKILGECNLLASIALPRNTFFNTAQKTYILALEKRHTATDPRPNVFCAVASSVGESLDAIVRAGGCGFVPQGPQSRLPRNADYLLDDYIIDLKALEEEGLGVESRQDKLAALFRSVLPNQRSITLDPTLLPPEKRRECLDIIGSRIKKHIQSASDQVRQTKLQIGNASLRGGVILLNSGFSSLPPSILEEQAERCAKKDSTQIEVVVCISVWLLTNGFDTTMNFQFYPNESTNSTIQKLKKAFWERENEWMTEFARSGFMPTGGTTTPMQAVAFERDGIYFSFLPPQLPDSRFVE